MNVIICFGDKVIVKLKGCGEGPVSDNDKIYFFTNIQDQITTSDSKNNASAAKIDCEKVKRTVRPIEAYVLKDETKSTVSKSETFTNPSQDTTKFTVQFSEKVSDTLSSTWTDENISTSEMKVIYRLYSLFRTSKLNLAYTWMWGDNQSVSREVTVGSTKPAEIILKSGETTTATSQLYERQVDIKVDYEITLKGNISCNNVDIDVNEQLEKIDLPLKRIVSEIIHIKYHPSIYAHVTKIV